MLFVLHLYSTSTQTDLHPTGRSLAKKESQLREIKRSILSSYQPYMIIFPSVIATADKRYTVYSSQHYSTFLWQSEKEKKIYIYIHYPLEFLTRTFVNTQQISRTINETAHSLWEMKNNICTQYGQSLPQPNTQKITSSHIVLKSPVRDFFFFFFFPFFPSTFFLWPVREHVGNISFTVVELS